MVYLWMYLWGMNVNERVYAWVVGGRCGCICESPCVRVHKWIWGGMCVRLSVVGSCMWKSVLVWEAVCVWVWMHVRMLYRWMSVSVRVRGRHVCDRCVRGDVCIYMSEYPCWAVRTERGCVRCVWVRGRRVSKTMCEHLCVLVCMCAYACT